VTIRVVELTTRRLLLREFREGDRDEVHAYASDPEVSRFADWGPNTVEETAGFLRFAVGTARDVPRLHYALAMVERAGGAVVGSVALSVTSFEHRRAETGYVVAPSRWGRGFATEAAREVVRFGFERLGLHRISATCDPANPGSAAVLRKIGLTQEGYLREHFLIRGEWRDRLLFAILQGEL
jgi:RimJ/RimL family protein N-acetyltransferase